MKYIVGVDEAGRGPLAGPVAVGIVVAPLRLNIPRYFPGVADSKKLSEKKREEIFTLLVEASGMQTDRRRRLRRIPQGPGIRYTVVFGSAKDIDKKGISAVVRQCVAQGVRKLVPDPKGCVVLLDGLLHAPPAYTQKTIIRGDASEPIISLASIAAKVSRDRLMVRFAKKYPGYGFEVHKGYGTKQHLASLRTQGPCAIHRTTFRGVGGV